jgi:signal transduction histidine kinase
MADDLEARDVALRSDLQADLPCVAADRVQIQQVIANLTRNGIEAMDGMTNRPKALSIKSRHEADEVAVLITDEGVGIDDTQVVFESFYTTKAGGMGMGLSICRSIIEAHGGRLWATQDAPHGATFGFALRIATEESA